MMVEPKNEQKKAKAFQNYSIMPLTFITFR